jgi:hypothetical protein
VALIQAFDSLAPPQYLELTSRHRAGALGSFRPYQAGQCRILVVDFREFTFHALGRIRATCLGG